MRHPQAARLRQLAGRGKRLGRRAAGAARRGLRSLTGRPSADQLPLLTAVVAVRPGSRHLAECLNSLLAQTLRRLDVVVVVGPGVAEPSIADSRVRVLRRPNHNVAAARNAGAAAARAPYLAFVDADDTVPADAFTMMTRTLQRSGSDFVVGAVRLVRNGRTARTASADMVHDLDRIGVTVDDFPVAMQDVMLVNRVFRRTFWQQRIAPLAEDGDSADIVAAVTGYVRASSFDLLKSVTYQRQVRADHTTIVQERYDRAMLDDRVPALERLWRLVASEASPAVAGAWLGGVIDSDLGTFLEHAGGADDRYRDRLQRASRSFLDEAGPEVWRHVRVDRRLRLWLGAQGNWSLLDRLLEYFRLNGLIPQTLVRDGRVFADLPLRDELGRDLPEDLLELSDSQTALATCLERAFFDAEGHLVIHGWALIRGVDLSDTVPQQRATLVDAVTHEEVPLVVEPRVDSAATRWANQLHQSFDSAAFGLRIDVDALPPPDPAAGARRWVLHLETSVAGVERRGVVRTMVRNGIAHRMRARQLRDPSDAVRVVPALDPRLGFVIQLRTEWVRAFDLSAHSRRVRGRLRIIQPLPTTLVSVSASCGAQKVTAPLTPNNDGSLAFALLLPEAGPNAEWTFRAVDENHGQHRVSWPDEASAGDRVEAADASVGWTRTSRGFCSITTDVAYCDAEGVEVTGEEVRLLVRAAGASARSLEQAVLHSHRSSVPVRRVGARPDGRHELVFPATASVWGGPMRPLPAASYTVDVAGVPCGVGDALLEACPITGWTSVHRFHIGRVPGQNILALTMGAPLADDERGRRSQRLLGQWYNATEFEPRHAVLFQCYRGEFATDSQLALHRELVRRGSSLELVWAVADLSVVLPEKAVPVLFGSRAWYEAVGSSRYLCSNVELDRFFRKRPYQRYLQTFHGYPFKSMGISLWRAQGKAPEVIDAECARRNANWDSVLVPAPFCEAMYREEYRYSGEVLVTGYPRDDALVSCEASTVRTEVLQRIGVPVDKTVLLYAPTWRDTVATGAFRAKIFDALDLNGLVDQLGQDFVVLFRGHNYNLREGEQVSTAVVDVTTYPEVNDLILAADVAVLDYSSLRFDWLLTGKPALFFVPDLADYLSARTALYEYAPTAPGPLLRSTDEVVEALTHLAEVSAQYEGDRKAFNQRFNQLNDGHATARVVERFFGSDAGGEVPAVDEASP
jgi:CDP-glycerol glycerophosphotransferase